MTTGLRISDVGILQFTNETGNQELGYIFVDSLIATAFIERTVKTGSPLVPTVSQICQVITTQATPTSSSPSAVLEIDSTSGALLLSRLSATDMTVLNTNAPKNGMILYNTTAQQFQFYQNGDWVGLPSSGSIGTVTGPNTSKIGDVTTWGNSTGTLIGDSGVNITGGNISGVNSLNVSGNINLGNRGSTSSILATYGNIQVYCASPAGNDGSITAQGSITGNSITAQTITAQSYFMSQSDMYVVGTLRASGSANYTVSGQHGYLNNCGAGSNAATYTSPTAIVCNYGGILATLLQITSSRNIKNILEEGKNVAKEATDLFKIIPFKKYEFKDKIQHGNKAIYGMIAEELREVMPGSVSSNRNAMPNIMQSAEVIDTFNTENSFTTTLSFKGEFVEDTIKEMDHVRLIDDIGTQEAVIVSIKDNLIVVEAKKALVGEVFVYGTYGDCPVICKDDVFEMGMVVLQSALKRIETLEKIIGV